MAIKMRVETNKNAICCECKTKYANTKEMYEVYIVDTSFVLCAKCLDVIFSKCLKAQCNYNGRVKSQEDMKRIENSKVLADRMEAKKNVKPECYGDFKDNKDCKSCSHKFGCERIWNEQWEDV